MEALYGHYQELRRWNEKLSLIGPGTVEEVLRRHYGEALAALPLLPETPFRLVDVGSGGGFPGFVLAAACPRAEVTLIEPRQRKWAFLQAAARRAQLPVHCLNARVGDPIPGRPLDESEALPEGLSLPVDVVTMRALKLPAAALEALAAAMAPEGRFLLWVGVDEPEPPAGWELGPERPLAGGDERRIREMRRAEPSAGTD